jgi:hypothetical protein
MSERVRYDHRQVKVRFRISTAKAAGRLTAIMRHGGLLLQETCPCRKSDPDIMVVQSAEDRQGYNSSDRMDGSGYRSVIDYGQMRSSDIVVFRRRAEHIASEIYGKCAVELFEQKVLGAAT